MKRNFLIAVFLLVLHAATANALCRFEITGGTANGACNLTGTFAIGLSPCNDNFAITTFNGQTLQQVCQAIEFSLEHPSSGGTSCCMYTCALVGNVWTVGADEGCETCVASGGGSGCNVVVTAFN